MQPALFFLIKKCYLFSLGKNLFCTRSFETQMSILLNVSCELRTLFFLRHKCLSFSFCFDCLYSTATFLLSFETSSRPLFFLAKKCFVNWWIVGWLYLYAQYLLYGYIARNIFFFFLNKKCYLLWQKLICTRSFLLASKPETFIIFSW